MRTFALAIACVFMLLGLTMGYGSYGYNYFPYASQGASNTAGIGQGGILIALGVLFIFLLLIGNNGLNLSNSNTPSVSLIG